jgi:predicted  nucleic acid-binding Zn-ribbon protein
MRHFSIVLLVLCMLLPPVLYLSTVAVVEREVRERFTRTIEDISTGDPQPLLEGSVRLQDVLRTPDPPAPPNPIAVARENFALLSEGLVVQTDVIVEHNRPLSNTILALYVGAALAVLLVHYRSAGGRARRDELERRRELERLEQLQRANTDRLSELQGNRESLLQELGSLRSSFQDERSRAERNEDDLIAEIQALQKRLQENQELQDVQQREIQSLRDSLAGNEKDQRREDKGRQKTEAVFRRRFGTLYKNLSVNDRALEGLAELNEELRLKAEEIIHQLNSQPDLVTVKRKVFGRKNRETVLEVVFAYKGRLYFRRGPDRRIEVLAVGTKNTQERELEFLNHL